MPRIIKHPDLRRTEILDAAESLFYEHGYDATSLDDVIGRAGVSKGGFYHHFDAKADLLEGLAERTAARMLERIAPILEDETLNAFERLDRFFAHGRKLKIDQAPQVLRLFESVFRPQNLLLFHRLHRAVTRITGPALTRIIVQGKEEGTFDVADPEATAETVLTLATASYDSVVRLMQSPPGPELDAAVDAFERRLRAQSIAIDRVLGLPDGSICFVEPGFTCAMMHSRRPPDLRLA